jgi:hypothetical protein
MKRARNAAAPPHRIARIEPSGQPMTLTIAWRRGGTSTVDLSAVIARSAVLAALADPELFARVRVDEWGWSAVWTDEIDLGADQLWRWAGEQAGELMPAEDFRAWRSRNRLSLSGAAEALGLSRRMVAYYDSGQRAIPKTVLLATRGFEASQAA